MAGGKIRRAVRYAQGILGLNDSDFILSSFPRSGNTWVRLVLCNLISLAEWDGITVDFDLLDQTMVALGVSDLRQPWPHATIPRVVKVHWRYLPIFRKVRGAIGVVRDPRDVMVSFYHYRRDRKNFYGGTFGDFIRSRHYGIRAWFKHYASWVDHWTLILRYEDLRRDTLTEFQRILPILGIDCPESVLREAVKRSDFARVRQLEKRTLDLSNENARFVRDGRAGQWRSYFSEEDRAYYRRISAKYTVNDYIEDS